MQATPPETTEVRGVNAAATAPDSASPIRGAPATAAICMPIIRPRRALMSIR